jgi:hypothetical protein
LVDSTAVAMLPATAACDGVDETATTPSTATADANIASLRMALFPSICWRLPQQIETGTVDQVEKMPQG